MLVVEQVKLDQVAQQVAMVTKETLVLEERADVMAHLEPMADKAAMALMVLKALRAQRDLGVLKDNKGTQVNLVVLVRPGSLDLMVPKALMDPPDNQGTLVQMAAEVKRDQEADKEQMGPLDLKEPVVTQDLQELKEQMEKMDKMVKLLTDILFHIL